MFEVGSISLQLHRTPKYDLFIRPIRRRNDGAAAYPVVGSARLLPVTNRGHESRSFWRILKTPVRRAKWCANLRPTCFRSYLKEERGLILEPYQTLPALPLGGDSGVVREGTGAIRVYQDLLFDRESTLADRQNRLALLRQYCRLDTAAMLMIWVHWTGRYGLPRTFCLSRFRDESDNVFGTVISIPTN